MDEFDLMKELYGEPEEDGQSSEDDEIQLNIRDYRADDAFEKMLAELNGKFSAPAGGRQHTPAMTIRSRVKEQPAEPQAQPAPENAETAEKSPDVQAEAAADVEGVRSENVQAEEKAIAEQTAPPEPIEEAEPEPPPPPKPAVKRKPQPAKKSPEQLEKERRERERRAEQELFERREREAREREQQFIEKISNIWNTPEFAEGGRVEMNIRTEDRKEIRITLPVQTETQPDPEYTPLIPPQPQLTPEEEKKRLEEAARRDAQNRTEKAGSRKISIRKRR